MKIQQQRIVIVGLGGVGSWIVQGLCPFLQYSEDNYLLIPVDGDDYENKNHTRQIFTELGPKAEVQARWIVDNFSRINVMPLASYISANGAKDSIKVSEVIETDDIVFSCVDNHKTRKVLAKYCEKLSSVTLISGGNEYTDGNIQVFIRHEGVNLTSTLDKYHPEIAAPKDKAPFEMSCDELARTSPQLIFTNLIVASLMLNAFYSIKIGKFDTLKSEMYFDILQNTVAPRIRKV